MVHAGGLNAMPEDQSLPLMIGEMRGQLRELVHQMANLAHKFEGVARTVDESKHLPGMISENRASIAALEARVTALDTIEHQRKGAITLGTALLKSLPWLIPAGVGGAALAIIGKVIGV